MATHTISNASTLHGWLESMGLDDIIMNPCGCIFGEEDQQPVPVPGQRRYQGGRGGGGANQRPGSVRGRNNKNGVYRQQSSAIEQQEEKNPFAAFFGLGG